MSSAGPEVLFGSNQRPESVSIPPFHLLQERTYLRPTTLSSWLKQTILLCYKQADQQALDLVQVKALDIRAFAASKALYGGVSLDQIMQACHWKAHNTFTNFYLEDLTCSDNDNNMYLGPVQAAQQVLDPSLRPVILGKKRRGWGHIRYNQVFKSPIPGSRYRFTSQDVTGKVIMSADLSVSWHYVVTLRRGRTRPREQLLLQNYKA